MTRAHPSRLAVMFEPVMVATAEPSLNNGDNGLGQKYQDGVNI